MPERTISVLEGSTFVVGDRDGNVRLGDGREHGFFCDDTRFVSRWVLHVDDAPLELLGLDQGQHYLARFFLTPALAPAPDAQAPYSVMRHRLLDQVWLEELTIISHRHETSEVRVALEVDADFADLFEVKDGTVARRDVRRHSDADGSLRFTYDDGAFHRSLAIAATPAPEITDAGLAYTVTLAPGEQWTAAFTLTPTSRQPGVAFPPRERRGSRRAHEEAKAAELAAWLAAAPALEAEDGAIARTYRASLADLAALRLHPDLLRAATLPAAGLPWFMALFGRDSLITSYQALPYLPELAATTLRVLAGRQAVDRDDVHEREPGKILHELRFGELTATGRRPHSPYFGTADATPLFLVLLDEYHRWTGDDALVADLELAGRAALAWIDESGDADGDGYVEYARRNVETGLLNQCWKDSWDSMQFADGTLARGPIATCEIQGYAYDARRRAARLARAVWRDEPLAERLEMQAEALREAIRRDFWMPARGCPALALDGEKRQVDALTSNIGHLLWSGVLDQGEAHAVAERLLDDELFSGWGIRTLGRDEAGYNPLGYHTGTVWPHENSLIVAGLARYGEQDAAEQVGGAILRAAPHFEHRLPEVFAGYPREVTGVPVAFPTASRPQAWAAGAPLLILTSLLGLEPGDEDVAGSLPDGLGAVRLGRAAGRRTPAGAADVPQ